MFKDLSPGIKISITRSINTTFESYMNGIQWSESKFNMEQFVEEWRKYINKNSSWYDKISDDVKNSPAFHEELAMKINETVEKILSEEPTAQQMEEIEKLQKEVGQEYDYSCKLEAKFVIDSLQNQIKKKQNN